MTSLLASFTGSCHCGALGFCYETAIPVAEWRVRACQCGFCRAHGVLTTSDPSGRLSFRVTHAERLERYRFGLKTADFLLCQGCGVYIGAQIETPQGAFGIVNIRAMMPLPGPLPAAAPADYGSENARQRVERRERRWTPLGRIV